MVWWAIFMHLPFPYEFRETLGGHIMYNSYLISQGENPFVDPREQVSTGLHYTPGYDLLVAPLIRVFGLEMWIGRMVSIIATLIIYVLLFRISSRLAGGRFYGFASILLFTSLYGVVGEQFDSIHPDSWMIAWGLLTLYFSELSMRRAWLLPAAVITGFLSYFTKQMGLAFIMGAGLYFLVVNRRHLVYYAAGVGLLTLVVYLIGDHLTDGGLSFFTIMQFPKNPFVPTKIVDAFRILFIEPIALWGGIGYYLLYASRGARLWNPYLASFAPVALVYLTALLKEGGAENDVYSAVTLMTIIIMQAFSYFRTGLSGRERRTYTLFLMLLLVQQLTFFSKVPTYPTKEYYKTAERIEGLVRETEGEVLMMHRISYAYLNGRPVYDSAAVIMEWDHAGIEDWSRLERLIEQKYFERIFFTPKIFTLGIVKPKILEKINKNYYPELTIKEPKWYQTTPMSVFHRRSAP
jgi:hypothetical protein